MEQKKKDVQSFAITVAPLLLGHPICQEIVAILVR